MKILLVENNSTIGAQLKSLLTSNGHTVEWAINGKCVLIKLPVMHPDLIVMDYFLGDTDGLTVLAQVRTDPRIDTIPVILMTAAATAELPSTLPHDVTLLRKPFEFPELLDMIAKVVHKIATVAAIILGAS